MRASRPRSLFSLGTPASYSDGVLVLYDRAFLEDENLARVIVHELAHHLHEKGMKSEFQEYKTQLGWEKGALSRENHLESDSLDSPEEDFANNFEAYVFDRGRLRKELPGVFKWFVANLGSKFDLRDCER